MSSSLTTCSSTAEDEFSSDVFGQGGNEVNDGGTTSVSDGNSRKTAIDGGMKRKMTELFILTVVNITVTVALISFIAPIENGRVNAELESLKKSVGKMEQQHGNNAGEQKLSQLQNDQKELLEKISELEKQQKEQTKVTGDQLSKSQNDQKKLLERISKMEKQQKEQSKDGQQTEFYAKINTDKDMRSKWPRFQQLIDLVFCILLALIKPSLCVFLYPILLAFILEYVGLDNTGDGDEAHWILNIILNLYMTNILGDTLGYVPGIIHAIWYIWYGFSS